MMEEREDVYSKVVRAGKRTYFFDVRSTRGNDLFLTVTESKKRTHEDGGVSYEKHKNFRYKEDFEKFMDELSHTLEELERIREHRDALQAELHERIAQIESLNRELADTNSGVVALYAEPDYKAA